MKSRTKRILLTVLGLAFTLSVALFATACDNLLEKNALTVSYVCDEDPSHVITLRNFEEGDEFYLIANPYTQEGYTFVAWNDGEEDYAAGAKYTMPAHSVKFTASWVEKGQEPVAEYTVTYVGGEEAEGEAPEAAKYAVGTVFTLASNPFTREGYEFVAWNDGRRDYAEGAEYTMPAHDVTVTAKWKEIVIEPDTEDLLAGKGFVDFSTLTYYGFNAPDGSDADYSVLYLYNQYSYWYANATDYRYTFESGVGYTVEKKVDGDWTELASFPTAKDLTTLTVGENTYLLNGAQHTLTLEETFGEETASVDFTFTPDMSVTYNGYATVLVNFGNEAVYNGHEVVSFSSYSAFTNTVYVNYAIGNQVYRATVNFKTNTSDCLLYGVQLTANVEEKTFRGTFTEQATDGYYAVDLEILDGETYRKLGSSRRQGDGNGGYTYTVSEQIENIKYIYTVRYFQVEGTDGYFTVEIAEEKQPVTLTVTTDDGQWQANFRYVEDPNDVEITWLGILTSVGDYSRQWASSMYYGDNTVVETGKNSWQFVYHWKEYFENENTSWTEDRETIYTVRYVPAAGGEAAQLIVKVAENKEITIDGPRPAWEDMTDTDDGRYAFGVKLLVNEDGAFLALEEVIVYRALWANKEWQTYAVFTPDVAPVNGEYTFTGTAMATYKNNMQKITWHLRVVLNENPEAEQGYDFEVHFQNEVSFEINGEVIEGLTVLVDEGGDVTLPAAEVVEKYLKLGQTFVGWQLDDEDFTNTVYTTELYPAQAETPENFPAPKDAKFVAKLETEDVGGEEGENLLAGTKYVDWANRTYLVFGDTFEQGFYTATTHSFDSNGSASTPLPVTGVIAYKISNGTYTVYVKEGDEFVSALTFTGAPASVLSLNGATYYQAGVVQTYSITESGKDAPIEFSFSFDFTGEPNFYGSTTYSFVIGDYLYNGKEGVKGSTAFYNSNWIVSVNFTEGETIYDASVNMSTLVSTLKVYGSAFYTADNTYKAVLENWYDYSGGYFAYCTLYRNDDGHWTQIGNAQTSRDYTYGYYEFNAGAQDDGTTMLLRVRYFAEADQVPAHVTVETVTQITIDANGYQATFFWGEDGVVSMKELRVFNDYGSSPVYGTITTVSENVFELKTYSTTTYTVTFVPAHDDVPATFTVSES